MRRARLARPHAALNTWPPLPAGCQPKRRGGDAEWARIVSKAHGGVAGAVRAGERHPPLSTVCLLPPALPWLSLPLPMPAPAFLPPARGGTEVSLFPNMTLRRHARFSDTLGTQDSSPNPCLSLSQALSSEQTKHRHPQTWFPFGAQWLACLRPCPRFKFTLTSFFTRPGE